MTEELPKPRYHDFRIHLGLTYRDSYTEMDGQRLKGVTAVKIEGDTHDATRVTVTFIASADVTIVGGEVVTAYRADAVTFEE